MKSGITHFLELDDDEVAQRWQELLNRLERQFGREAGIESILFLIGVQSSGRGYEPKLSKQAKQDLIMEGTRCAFETLGLYKRVGMESDGSIVWKAGDRAIPKLDLPEQEKLLRVAILSYFAAIRNAS